MPKLNPTYRGLLETAASHPEGAIDDAGVAGRVITAMVRKGLVLAIPLEDGGRKLLITTEGRAVIGSSPAAPPAPPPAAPTIDVPSGKLGLLVQLLCRPGGAAIEEMVASTGWQAHSVRGALSGALKKGRGYSISSEKTDAGRVYRITEAGAS